MQRALVFTDVVESTRLSERVGDERAAHIWAAHDGRAREAIARHRGLEIDRADGFFALFDDARDALAFAFDYHAAIADLGLTARAGLHVGEVTLRENPPGDVARGAKALEVDGIAKPLAGRLMALARGGQTLSTSAAVAALAQHVPPRARVESHGWYRLKGLGEPVEVFEIGDAEAAAFAPPADAEKAYRVVDRGGLWIPVRDVPRSLPAERDAFVGRTAELRRLAERLEAGVRLLTVLGTAGTGKTRLARRYGWTWLGDWPGGVYFCDLSDARSLDGIYFAAGAALGVPLGREDAGAQLGNAIAGRGRCLVILDNFEQVVTHAAATVGRWLDRAPLAAFIVSTRERLHIAGEEVFPVEPLPVDRDAVELFATRAQAQRPDFALSPANRPAVAEIVRLLDGLPLAIELAAARVRLLSPAQLVERLRDRFTLLAGARGAAARQATLRGAIDWSWELLAPWEQAAFAQCSIFDGGFTLEAAERVLDLSPWPEALPVMDVVQALSDKSLLRTWLPAGDGRYDFEEPYFAMYISIREYAQEKLASNGAAKQRSAEQSHGRYFARFGVDDAIEALSRAGGVRRRRGLALELDNLVAACRRAVIRNDPGTALCTYLAASEVFALHGPFSASAALGEQVLNSTSLDDAQRVSAVVTLADALRRAGRVEDAQKWLDEALTLSRHIGSERLEAKALTSLGTLHRDQARGAQAKECLEAALAVARRTGDHATEVSARSNLGILHRQQGRSEEAREHFEAGLALAEQLGDRRAAGIALGSLGLLNTEGGQVDDARARLEAARDIAREVGDRVAEGMVEGNLGQLCSELGRRDEARQHIETALAIHREVGNRRVEGIVLGNLGTICTEQGLLTQAEERFEGALAIAREIGNRRHEAFLLASLGLLRHGQGRVQEARQSYEAALRTAQEVGDRRTEGIVQSRLGLLAAEQGQFADARACYELALASAQVGGYRRLEGVVRGGFGDLLARQGRTEEALESLRAGEALLREVHDQEELGKVLCFRGKVEARIGKRDQAFAALAEAMAIAGALRSIPESELVREIAALRDQIRPL